jgi:hypothetical protein
LIWINNIIKLELSDKITHLSIFPQYVNKRNENQAKELLNNLAQFKNLQELYIDARELKDFTLIQNLKESLKQLKSVYLFHCSPFQNESGDEVLKDILSFTTFNSVGITFEDGARDRLKNMGVKFDDNSPLTRPLSVMKKGNSLGLNDIY